VGVCLIMQLIVSEVVGHWIRDVNSIIKLTGCVCIARPVLVCAGWAVRELGYAGCCAVCG